MNKIIKTEFVEWKKLKLFQPKNLKTISKKQLDKLKTSLKNNGFKAPFYVWQENKERLWCLDGHTRIPVLKLLEEEGCNIPDELPANFIDCRDKKEAKKTILIYNSSYANINKDEMFDFVSDLNLEELNFEIDMPSIDFNVEKEEKTEIPELEESKIIKMGDLIQLNNHFLVCGSCLELETYEKLIKNKIDFIFTDPPYDLNDYSYLEYVDKFIENANILIMCADKQIPEIIKKIKYIFKRLYVLKTNIASPTNNDVYINHIPMLRFLKGKRKFINIKNGGRSVVDINYRKNIKNKIHKHEKEVAVFKLFQNYFIKKNENILDMFVGSGANLIASDINNVNFFGIEIDPRYCELIIKRFYNFCIDNSKKCTILINNNKFNLKMLNSRKGD